MAEGVISEGILDTCTKKNVISTFISYSYMFHIFLHIESKTKMSMLIFNVRQMSVSCL